MNGLLFGIVLVALAAGIGGEEISWWEFPLPIALSWIVFALFREAAVSALLSDIRYIHSYVTSATHMLAWRELVHYTAYEPYTDSDGKLQMRAVPKTRIDDHDEYWCAEDAHSNGYDISESDFQWYCQRFGKSQYRETSHPGQYSGGGKYVTDWPETDETIWPVSFTQEYENRGQATANIYKYRTLSVEETKGLYYYPATDKWVIDGFLLPEGLSLDESDVAHIRMLWAKLGVNNDVTPWVLVFKNQPVSIATLQETFWARGNDNDFVLCININDANEITWAHVFAWSEDNVLEATVAAKVSRMGKLDPRGIGEYLYKELSAGYKMPNFETMFKHIKIEVPTSTLMWSSLTSLLVGGALLYWILTNSFNWIEELQNLNQWIENIQK